MDAKKLLAGLSQVELDQIKLILTHKDSQRKAKEQAKKISGVDAKTFKKAKSKVTKLVNQRLAYTSMLPVTVSFRLNSRGKVQNIMSVDGSSLEVAIQDHKIRKVEKEIEDAYAEYKHVARVIRQKYKLSNYEIVRQLRIHGRQTNWKDYLYY